MNEPTYTLTLNWRVGGHAETWWLQRETRTRHGKPFEAVVLYVQHGDVDPYEPDGRGMFSDETLVAIRGVLLAMESLG